MKKCSDDSCDDDDSGRRSMDGESLSISISGEQLGEEKTTSTLEGRFVHSQLLIDCLLRMGSTSEERETFIAYCRREHANETREIELFEKDYTSEHAVYWYTKNCFVYRLLNQSLRKEHIDSLFQFRFFIRDVEAQLQKNRSKVSTTLYRGQSMSLNEVLVLKKSQKRLISINQFFSTSSDPQVAESFYNAAGPKDDLHPVLFIIEANPSRPGTKPFADIHRFSQFDQEKEYLMMIGSVFRLDRVECDAKQRWTIFMTLCSDKDHDLQSIVHHMTNQYGKGQTRLLVFGHVLVDMARFNEAEDYYRRLLEELKDDDSEDRSHCYHALSKIALEKGDYPSSLAQLKKSMELTESRSTVDPNQLAYLHTGFGEVYQKQGKLSDALISYLKAMLIWKDAYDDDHEYLAWCYNNLGIISDLQGDYSQSLEFLRQAKKIKEFRLPDGHPCRGNTQLNLGNVFYHQDQYDQAMEHYQLAFKIFRTSLTPYHPSIASALRNIGLVLEMTDEHERALKTYEEVVSIRTPILSPSHPDMDEIHRDIQRVSKKLNANCPKQ